MPNLRLVGPDYVPDAPAPPALPLPFREAALSPPTLRALRVRGLARYLVLTQSEGGRLWLDDGYYTLTCGVVTPLGQLWEQALFEVIQGVIGEGGYADVDAVVIDQREGDLWLLARDEARRLFLPRNGSPECDHEPNVAPRRPWIR